MNHDITHCEGKNCANRETCFRYKAHKEIEGTDVQYRVYYLEEHSCKKFKTLK